jgi:hypothetical protein
MGQIVAILVHRWNAQTPNSDDIVKLIVTLPWIVIDDYLGHVASLHTKIQTRHVDLSFFTSDNLHVHR